MINLWADFEIDFEDDEVNPRISSLFFLWLYFFRIKQRKLRWFSDQSQRLIVERITFSAFEVEKFRAETMLNFEYRDVLKPLKSRHFLYMI